MPVWAWLILSWLSSLELVAFAGWMQEILGIQRTEHLVFEDSCGNFGALFFLCKLSLSAGLPAFYLVGDGLLFLIIVMLLT